ncbi:Allene oxide synthase [Abeliophyllum distichum]|uniref:Allene oxide synthase n=1 Tax=Abeliophyllum distichum TaxID=126358 RepID=A0ABD1TJD6_9LAMI
MGAMERMPLMKSVVYEALRIEPPVASQYAKAKRDFVIESHDAAFRIKEGKILFGFQPFATKDLRIFHRPEEFLPGRFVGENREKLLKHVVWSNRLEMERSTMVVLDEGVGWGKMIFLS